MTSIYLDNDGVRLHALDNERDGGGTPVLVVPGMGEEATEYQWMLDALGDRRVVIVDVRGRGDSEAPARGYTWRHHYHDVLAAMTATGLRRPVAIGFSRGSPYVLGAALHAPEPMAGLIINDYQARQVGLPAEAVDKMLTMRIRERPLAERMPVHAVRGLVEESEEISLWERLSQLGCRLLVVRGGRPSSLVDDEAAERYRRAASDVDVVTLPERGHDLWSRDIAAYLTVVTPFLASIDATTA